MRTRVFTVNENTWSEHRKAGIAAINDPFAENDSPQSYAIRQKVMTEIAGIRPGDRLFFYIQRTKEIIGGFQATTKSFYDGHPLFEEADHINHRYPFRVGFKPIIEYPRTLHVNEIWAGRDAGRIWTMQQARGDVVGRHACWPLTRREGDLLEQMLQELNIVFRTPESVPKQTSRRNVLPLDTKIVGKRFPHLNYEATLQSLLLEGLADGKWRDVFGEYDDFLPFVATSEGKEIDILLLRHNEEGEVLWYQLLELKSDRFRHDHLLQLLAYETWMTSSTQVGGNPRSVHMVALANRYDDDVLSNVNDRSKLKQKLVHLLEYSFSTETRQLEITRANQFG